MKDATGELSMTAIAVVAIAAIAGIFTVFLLPRLKSNISTQANCSAAFNCEDIEGGKRQKCQYCTAEDEKCEKPEVVYCPKQQ